MNNLRAISQPKLDWVNEINGMPTQVHICQSDDEFTNELPTYKAQPVHDPMMEIIMNRVGLWIEGTPGAKAFEELKSHIAKHYTINPRWAETMKHVTIAEPNSAA